MNLVNLIHKPYKTVTFSLGKGGWRIDYSSFFPKTLSLILLVALVSISAFTQVTIPLNEDYRIAIEQNQKASFLKPYLCFTDSTLNPDSILYKPHATRSNSWLYRKMFHEHFIEHNSDGLIIKADPILGLKLSYSTESRSRYFDNTRGARFLATFDNKFFIETSFYENQSTFPFYLNDYVNRHSQVPGQGYVRRNGNQYDYSHAEALAGLKIGTKSTLTFGHSRLFAGEGYRSVLLSDNSFSFPFIRFEYYSQKWQYKRVMAILMSDYIPYNPIGAREKKLAGFNFLSFTPSDKIEISFFEGLIYKYPNSNKKIEFNPIYLNPFIFANSLTKDNNSVLGLNLKTKLSGAFHIYGQLGMNNLIHQNGEKLKVAYQAGFKYFNALTIPNLYLQAEYNAAQDSFGLRHNELLSYSHYSQSITNPIGSNYKEMIAKVNYKYKRLGFKYQLNMSEYGTGDAPADRTVTTLIYKPQPHIGEEYHRKVQINDVSVSWLINPAYNLKIETGFLYRIEDNSLGKEKLNLIYVGLRTYLDNWYYDF